jgi:NAD(P)-dependent dehydrogenase (short-subunit alcohol dehydrogenase family)
MSHDQRAYVVTAAAGGIGTELVGLLLEGGAHVLACDISSRRLAALAERFPKQRDQLKTLKADTADETGVESVRQTAQGELGEIHGLANIAGGIVGIGEDLIDRPLEKITLDEFQQTYRLNLQGTFLMIRAFAPHFRQRRYGKVVNVASLAAFGNFDHMGNAAYDAAKAAVVGLGLTHTLCRSLGPDGIRVNVVAPGSVFTERVKVAFSHEFNERQRQRIPLQIHTGPRDVAEALAFFLSPLSDQISGELIRVSGGLR